MWIRFFLLFLFCFSLFWPFKLDLFRTPHALATSSNLKKKFLIRTNNGKSFEDFWGKVPGRLQKEIGDPRYWPLMEENIIEQISLLSQIDPELVQTIVQSVHSIERDLSQQSLSELEQTFVQLRDLFRLFLPEGSDSPRLNQLLTYLIENENTELFYAVKHQFLSPVGVAMSCLSMIRLEADMKEKLIPSLQNSLKKKLFLRELMRRWSQKGWTEPRGPEVLRGKREEAAVLIERQI